MTTVDALLAKLSSMEKAVLVAVCRIDAYGLVPTKQIVEELRKQCRAHGDDDTTLTQEQWEEHVTRALQRLHELGLVETTAVFQ